MTHRCDIEDKRVISRERGEAFAKDHGVKFFETSTRNNANIEKAFTELSEKILDNIQEAKGLDQTASMGLDLSSPQGAGTSRTCCR